MDASEYGFGLTIMYLESLNDCQGNSYYMDGVLASDDGTPYVRPNMVCIFERYEGDISWPHKVSNSNHGGKFFCVAWNYSLISHRFSINAIM